MKKFLTVLLALSVVFTYSFSSVGAVFADTATYTPDQFKAELEKIVDGYEGTLKGNIISVKNGYKYDDDDFTTIKIDENNSVKVSAKAVEEGINSFIEALVKDMKAEITKATKDDEPSYSEQDYTDAKEAIDAVVKSYGATEAEYGWVEINETNAAERNIAWTGKVDSCYETKDNAWTLAPAKGYAKEGTSYYNATPLPNINSQNDLNTALQGSWVGVKDGNNLIVINGPNPGSYTDAYSEFNQYFSLSDAEVKIGTKFDTLVDLELFDKEGDKETTTDEYPQKDAYYVYEVVKEAEEGSNLLDASNFKAALEATLYIVKAEAPRAEAYYTEKIKSELDEEKYSENKETFDVTINGVEETLTAQEMVTYAKEKALEAIKTAKQDLAKNKVPTKADYEKAIGAYEAAYKTAVETDLKNVKDNETLAGEEAGKVIDVDSAVAKLRAYAVGVYYGKKAVAKDANVTGWESEFGTDIYVKDTTGKACTIFGVKIADPAKITAAEAKALNAALYTAIKDTVAVAEITLAGVEKATNETSYVNALNEKLAELYDTTAGDQRDHSKFSTTVKNAYAIADVYQDVVDYGTKLKNIYKFGVKIYDDEKVDAVVAAAKAIVYANLNNATGTEAKDYFAEAIVAVYGEDATEADLMLDNSNALEKFEKAQKDAIAKFDKNVITYGDNKTPEADKKYKENIYASGAVTADDEGYGDIKDEAIEAIKAAQSYADIDAAFAVADAKLAQLLTKENEEIIKNLRKSYNSALEAYKLEKTAFLDMDLYDADDFDKAVEKGQALINKAGTEEVLKAAFAEAKALIDAVKTTEAIDADKLALETMLNALPLASKVTLENKADIEAARAAYDAYNKIPGVAEVDADKLTAAEKALAVLEKADLDKEIADIVKEIKAIGKIDDDKAAEAAVALKEKAVALQDKMDAFNEKLDTLDIKAVNDATSADLTKFLGEDKDYSVYYAEIYLAKKAIEAIGDKVENADPDVVAAAQKIFDALTDKQQYILDNEGYADRLAEAVAQVKANTIAAVRAFNISTTTELVKGKKMIVKWNVIKGDESAIDGYRVYYSTKKSNKGFKVLADVKGKKLNHTSIKKTVKKGTRVYYRVKAYKMIDGLRYLSSYSSAGHRTWK